MSTKITRESLISPDIDKVAISKKTMFVLDEDEDTISEVPIPESIKASGIIPEGYTVDYHLDPAVVIANLAKNNMTTIEEVPDELFAKMKAIVNDADNVTIAPRSVVEDKREAIEKSLRGDAGEAEGGEGEEGEDEEEEEEEEVPQGNISDDESDHTDDEHK